MNPRLRLCLRGRGNRTLQPSIPSAAWRQPGLAWINMIISRVHIMIVCSVASTYSSILHIASLDTIIQYDMNLKRSG